MSKAKFWKLKNAVESSGAELYIEGAISSEEWWGDEATPQALRTELKSITSNKITVIINSGGGDVWAGLAMYNALRELEAEVTVRVDGIAASIASVIAMAGDKIVMSPGSMMMIHKASAWAGGDSEDLKKIIEMLETVEESIVPIYADRTNQSREQIQEWMNEEKWMSAEEAVKLGFADEVATDKKAEAVENSFSGELALSMSATKASIDKALAHNEAEKEEQDVRTDTTQESDETVENPTPAEPVKETTEQSSPGTVEAVGTEEVQKDETEAVAVDTAQAKEQPTEKETEMSKETEIAQTQVIEPKNQAQPEATAKPFADYLKSEESVKDFANLLKNNVGKTFKSKEVQNQWREISVKNGITNPEVLALPEPLVSEIVDAIEASEIYNLMNHTGLDSYKVMWDSTDPDTDTSRAGQHNPDYVSGETADKTKDQQVLTFDDRTLEADFIYKYLVLDKKTVRENRNSGALMRFVMRELPQRIIREIERAAVIGDGRAANSKRKITSFIAVKADVEAGNSFAAAYTPVTGDTMAESVARARDLLLADGSVTLVAKKGYSTNVRFEKDTEGRLLYPLGTQATDILGVDRIIEPSWFTDATDPDFDAYLVVFNEYRTVGDNSIESFTNFKLETNENEYLQEIYKGGGLTGLKAAVGIGEAASS